MPNKRWATRVELAALLDAARDRLSTHEMKIEDLASDLGISKYHFSRLFKERYGITPARFATEVRWAEVFRLIETTTVPVGEIALKAGFESASSFSREFKRRFGKSPVEFRTDSR